MLEPRSVCSKSLVVAAADELWSPDCSRSADRLLWKSEEARLRAAGEVV